MWVSVSTRGITGIGTHRQPCSNRQWGEGQHTRHHGARLAHALASPRLPSGSMGLARQAGTHHSIPPVAVVIAAVVAPVVAAVIAAGRDQGAIKGELRHECASLHGTSADKHP